MGIFEQAAGSWDTLADRLDRRAAMRSWVAQEPVLAGESVWDLLPLTHQSGTKRAAHAVIAALVRIAARDGGDDPDAALVLVHLLRPGIRAQLRHLPGGADALQMFIAELVMVIRGFPCRRTEGGPGRLLLDTYHVLWHGELNPARLRPPRARLDESSVVDHAADQAAAYDSIELIDLLVWATRTGVIDRADADLLLDLSQSGGYGHITGLAKQRGRAASTARRRRALTVARLRDARAKFLAAA